MHEILADCFRFAVCNIKNKFDMEWRNEWNRNINFIGCYATWLKDSIYAITNIGV